MNRIILLYGGDSVEHEISILTALQIKKRYQGKYDLCLCYLNNGHFYMSKELENLPFYQNNHFEKKCCEVFFKANQHDIMCKHKKISFLGIWIVTHGLNCEDGTLHDYFKTLNIPVIAENSDGAMIGQDKILSKKLSSVESVPYFEVTRNMATFHPQDIYLQVQKINYPLIIKPATLGSSIGVYVVENEQELNLKMEELFHLSDRLIIEKKLNHFIELNIAALQIQDKIILSSIEKVSNSKVLTYEDKYVNEEKSMECLLKELPAKIDDDLENQIHQAARQIYQDLRAQLIVRMDFLYDLEEQKLYFNEINNIPGSLALYLFKAQNYDVNKIIDLCLEEGLYLSDMRQKMISSYSQNILKTCNVHNVKLDK